MKMLSKIGIILIVMFLVFNGCATTDIDRDDSTISSETESIEMVQNEPVSVKIIHTNDHHSHLDSDTYDLVLNGIATRLQMCFLKKQALFIV